MYLIQLLLPASVMPGGAAASEPVTQTRRELTEAFGGLTAYLRTPALGIWTSPAHFAWKRFGSRAISYQVPA